ncbi:discoidin domain-containing protein (plasmid) [Streptomyces sp. BI20]|uniref:discoidin domain-containing protein n=1 Tax=Streptomyces sp. BI20 TaxID=3403460 RepID=UPI003C71BE15
MRSTRGRGPDGPSLHRTRHSDRPRHSRRPRHSHRLRLPALLLSVALLLLGWPALTAGAAGGPDLAAGRPTAASAANPTYPAGNVVDGDPNTYWEGPNGAFPQWVQVDLGAQTRVDEVVLRLPVAWETRSQTLALQGSADGTSFNTLLAAAPQTFAPGTGNAVTLRFPAALTRYVRVQITANSGWQAAQLSGLEVRAAGESGTNLALGRTLTASGQTQNYGPGNAADGNRATYWESPNNALPQWIRVDLGASVRVDRVVLRLPENWEARSQTLKLQGSANGTDFTDLTAAAAQNFAPGSGNTVTLSFDATTTRYVRAWFTANSVQNAGQLSEFEVYGPTTGDTQAPAAPTGLAYTEPAGGQIRLTWTAATDNVGVTGYDVYADNRLLASVAGTVTTYTDNRPASDTVTYTVRAKDAAGNVSGDSNAVTRRGDTGDTQAPTAPTALSLTEPAAGQIRLAWGASTDNVGVSGYEVLADNAVRATVAGNVTTYTDTQPATATVTYTVRAKDAAGNRSADSNAVTRVGSGPGGSNLAVGRPVEGSSTVHTFVAANAVDNDTATYWEGAPGAYPSTLTVKLGANADLDRVLVKLNPDNAWSRRTQTFSIEGREQSASGFTTLVAEKTYTFDPASGANTVSIPATGRAADVRLRFTANSGSSNGQVAEFQVIGVPGPNPNLEVTALSASPSAPVESDPITLNATVRNSGTAPAPATTVAFKLGGSTVATATVPALAVGASEQVSVRIDPREAGSYPLSAVVDEAGLIPERNETDNTRTAGPLVVKPVDSSDLVASAVTWSPSSPSAGQDVAFSVTVRNEGTVAAAAGAHGITLTLQNADGTTLRTLTGSFSGALAPGASSSAVALGSWPAANGRYAVKVVLADDANELPVKRANNTSSRPLFVGRGANMPYDTYEAEDGRTGGGASVVGPNRTIGDLGGEASGRKAVTLDATGEYVEFTTRAATNTLVTRFAIPDAPGGGGIDSTINVYVDGTFLKSLPLTSKYAWLYGAEAGPGNSPSAGAPRHVYDEANLLLGRTVPAGSTIRLQKDTANTAAYYAIDFVDLEQAAAKANPDPAAYTVPTGFTHQDVQNALDRVRMDTTGKLVGVYLPAGTYETASKFQVYGKAVKVVGAGPWFTRFQAPSTQENTDIGFRAEASAKGSSFTGFAYFGNYTSRIDGPGKVFDFSNVSDIVIDDVWAEHQVCLYWGANTDRMTIRNSRIRNLFADGINMTNGSTDNLVTNNEARATGDDSFALFSAIDAGGADMKNNVYENLTTLLTWRAAGVAVYGGYDNTFRNIRIADTLVYSGITISSLDFGYPMNGFGTGPTTFENISIVRAGGHFWGGQTFPGIWLFSASKVFQGIRITDVDIVDPTYSGVMFQTQYIGGQPVNPIKDTILTNVTITGARKSGDAFDAKSGFGLWANELPEPGQGPAVGEVTVKNLRTSDNAQDIRNTTTTFRIVQQP